MFESNYLRAGVVGAAMVHSYVTGYYQSSRALNFSN